MNTSELGSEYVVELLHSLGPHSLMGPGPRKLYLSPSGAWKDAPTLMTKDAANGVALDFQRFCNFYLLSPGGGIQYKASSRPATMDELVQVMEAQKVSARADY